MTGRTVIATREADGTEGQCPACPNDVLAGQRVALVRDDELGHAWIHVRHLAEPEDAEQ